MMGVPKSADDNELSSTTTLARLGNDELEVGGSVGSGVADAPFSERRKGDRVRVGKRRKVEEPGIDERCRPA